MGDLRSRRHSNEMKKKFFIWEIEATQQDAKQMIEDFGFKMKKIKEARG